MTVLQRTFSASTGAGAGSSEHSKRPYLLEFRSSRAFIVTVVTFMAFTVSVPDQSRTAVMPNC